MVIRQVRITKPSKRHYWYDARVGEIVDIYDDQKYSFLRLAHTEWNDELFGGSTIYKELDWWINRSDCEIVQGDDNEGCLKLLRKVDDI